MANLDFLIFIPSIKPAPTIALRENEPLEGNVLIRDRSLGNPHIPSHTVSMYWTALPAWVPGSLLGLLALEWWITQSRLRALQPLPEPLDTVVLPLVCLCIPARNEALEVGPALDSWLAQDYPELRILVMDDGSTDGTSELLAIRAAQHPDRLRVIRIEHLPPGWLGKNHALHVSACQPEAQGAEWLLFADADVRAAPDLLRRSFAFIQDRPADLLTLIGTIDTVSPSERIFIPWAILHFLWATPARRVADPHSHFFCGTGGFTLVRRKVYEATGGHGTAPMEPIDDMLLAKRIKKAGFVNHMARCGPALRLRMYHNLPEIVRAMRKNILGVPYLWIFAPTIILVMLGFSLCPLWLALGGWPWAGITIWILWPAMMGEAFQRISHRAMDWIWILWPLASIIASIGMAWAFLDRLRGVNHWRGRNVRIR